MIAISLLTLHISMLVVTGVVSLDYMPSMTVDD
jgi:hypothetical protein